MNKLLLCLSFVLMSVIASAQKVFFIYLQSEPEQPFFIKMNEKVYNSSSTGYLILSQLVDSTYNFSLGFPQNKWPEQKFSVTLNRKDHGYLVKNFGEKGWGLFNLQNLSVQMSSSAPTAKVEAPVKEENKNVSVFTDILSKASDDPSLKEKTIIPQVEEKKTVAVPPAEIKAEPKAETKKEEVKEQASSKPVETIQPPVIKKEETKETPPVVKQQEVISQPEEKKESTVVKPIENPVSSQIKTEVVETVASKEEQPGIVQEEYKKSTVSKRSESSTTEGFGLTFIDDYDNGIKDTIRILIPNPKPVVAPVKEQEKEEKKFLDIQATPAKETIKEEPKTVTIVPTETTTPPLAKTNCSEVAVEADFFKLRKAMAAAENDDDMITEAKKQFKVKCFTTAQLKNLSTLFLNDENKYRFFDSAYNYTSDKEAFSGLQAELKDEYYINRFKAMLRN